MSTPAQPAAPAPQAPAAPAVEAPSGEMDVGAFSKALAAKPGDSAAAPSEEQQMEAQINAQTATKVDDKKTEPSKPAAEEPAKEKTPFDDLPSEEPEKAAEEKVVVEQEVDTSNWPKKQREAFAAARVAQKRLTDELSKAQEAIKQKDAALEEAKKTGKPDEAILQELEEHRKWRYAEDVKQSPEWKTAVAGPLKKVIGKLESVAKSVEVDSEKLLEATDEPDEFQRNSAIRRLFKAASEAADSPIDPDDLQAAIQTAINNANMLPDIYAKGEEMEANAAETWQSLQAKREQEKTEQSKASEADFIKAAEHLYPQLKAKWPSLFKDESTAKSVAEARIEATPEGQALQAQKAALFKPTLTELMTARAKIAELEKTVSAWKAGRPAVEDKGVTPSKPDDGEMDEEGFAAALRKKG